MSRELLRSLLRPSGGDAAADAANLLLRAALPVPVFVIHGVHKTVDGVRSLGADGHPWALAEEVRAMGVPAPTGAAVVATLVQVVAPLFILVGLGTRAASVALAAVLLGAFGQDLQAHRDPQLACLYLAMAAVLAVWGTEYNLRQGRPRGTL